MFWLLGHSLSSIRCVQYENKLHKLVKLAYIQNGATNATGGSIRPCKGFKVDSSASDGALNFIFVCIHNELAGKDDNTARLGTKATVMILSFLYFVVIWSNRRKKNSECSKIIGRAFRRSL